MPHCSASGPADHAASTWGIRRQALLATQHPPGAMRVQMRASHACGWRRWGAQPRARCGGPAHARPTRGAKRVTPSGMRQGEAGNGGLSSPQRVLPCPCSNDGRMVAALMTHNHATCPPPLPPPPTHTLRPDTSSSRIWSKWGWPSRSSRKSSVSRPLYCALAAACSAASMGAPSSTCGQGRVSSGLRVGLGSRSGLGSGG